MVLVGKPEGRDHVEEPGIGGRILLKWIFKQRVGGMSQIELAQNRDRWQILVNVVVNLQVLYNARISWLAENLLASQEGFCSMELGG
jgi:hypothetical protein